MTDAYVQDLCRQLNDLALLAGKSACVRTRSGKVQVDYSLSGHLWRKWINSEDESRSSTVCGIDTLFSTVNDYVASTLKMPPIVRNVIVSNKGEEGKVIEKGSNSPTAVKDEMKKDAVVQEQDYSAVQRAQMQFFNDSSAQTKEGLRALSKSTKECCKGIADLLSRRYCNDYEIVPLLIDELNFATLISTRIDNALQ